MTVCRALVLLGLAGLIVLLWLYSHQTPPREVAKALSRGQALSRWDTAGRPFWDYPRFRVLAESCGIHPHDPLESAKMNCLLEQAGLDYRVRPMEHTQDGFMVLNDYLVEHPQ